MSEKKVYAMAPEGCLDYVTAGKVYLTRPFYQSGDDSEGMEYFDPDFVSPWCFSTWKRSAHLNWGDWKRLELTEEEAEAINSGKYVRIDQMKQGDATFSDVHFNCDKQLESHPNSELDADQYTVGGDTVNMPSHYTSGEIECIDAIQAQMTPEQFAGYLRGNCVKYIWRYQHKGVKESLLKAQWYLNRLIDVVED